MNPFMRFWDLCGESLHGGAANAGDGVGDGWINGGRSARPPGFRRWGPSPSREKLGKFEGDDLIHPRREAVGV